MRSGVLAVSVAAALVFAPSALAGKQKTVSVDGAIRDGGKLSAKLVLEQETASDGSKHFFPHKLQGVKVTGIPWECEGASGAVDHDFGFFNLKFVFDFAFQKSVDLSRDEAISISGYAEPSGKAVKGRVTHSVTVPLPDGNGSVTCYAGGKFKAQ